ncbi:hypothetical protein ACP4OV_002414 [Aristida adscensionis]
MAGKRGRKVLDDAAVAPFSAATAPRGRHRRGSSEDSTCAARRRIWPGRALGSIVTQQLRRRRAAAVAVAPPSSSRCWRSRGEEGGEEGVVQAVYGGGMGCAVGDRHKLAL